MTQNRLELVLDRNHRSVVLDLLFALFFIVAATASGFALKGGIRQLTGSPIAIAAPADDLCPCRRCADEPLPS